MEENTKLKTVLTDDIEACLSIRRAVFVSEQSVPEELEVDGLDTGEEKCDHFLILFDDIPVGTFRCFYETEDTVHLQRFCILKDFRDSGYGRAALVFAERYYSARGAKTMVLNAQCTAVGFYEKCGYSVASDVFFDAGIPHKKMTKAI